MTSSGSDALAGLRQAVVSLDPEAFARCFSAGGWVRVPRPEGDVVLRGTGEIEQIGHELCELLAQLKWTPSQRFVAAGQVVEVVVVQARTRPGVGDWVLAAGAPDGEIRVPLRVVAALDPAGAIDSLTVWVDWAALHDPLGVDSALGAASALGAQARARDARGLRVIESEPGAAPLPLPPAPLPAAPGPIRPPAVALWWTQHRATLAGSVMALTAAAVIIGVAVAALNPIVNNHTVAAGSTSTASVLAAETDDTAAGTGLNPAPNRPRPNASDRPVITRENHRDRPTVQAGKTYTLRTDLLFATGSTELTVNARSELQKMAQIIRAKQVTGVIQVNGYTDDIGTVADNLRLSRDRARAVAVGLRNRLSGVTLELRPQGFGEPTNPNTTQSGRRHNRKVVIVLPD